MKWSVLTVGKPVFPWARTAVEGYLQRISHYASIEHVIVRDGPRDQVESQMLAKSEKALRVILDERGKAYRSLDLAHWVERQQLAGTKRVCLMIGGADGHSASFRKQADAIWNLSTLTLQHEVALVVLLEQIYRAHSILKKEPYHRE